MNISIPQAGTSESLIFANFSPESRKQKKLSYQSCEELFFFIKLSGQWYPLSKQQNDELDSELKKFNANMIPCKVFKMGHPICDDYVLEIKSQWTDEEKLILEHNRPWEDLF